MLCTMFVHCLNLQFCVKMPERRVYATSCGSTDKLNLFLELKIVDSICYYIKNDSAFSELWTSKLDSPLEVLKNQEFGTAWVARCLSACPLFKCTIHCQNAGETPGGDFMRLHRQIEPISDAENCCLNLVLHFRLMCILKSMYF